MLRVKKRDGSIVDFELKKIMEAMSKAFSADVKRQLNEALTKIKKN